MKFNKYWIFVAGFTLLNIIIFGSVSKKLETYVEDKMVESDQKTLEDLLAKSKQEKNQNNISENISESEIQ